MTDRLISYFNFRRRRGTYAIIILISAVGAAIAIWPGLIMAAPVHGEFANPRTNGSAWAVL
jgi:hypothetical protein